MTLTFDNFQTLRRRVEEYKKTYHQNVGSKKAMLKVFKKKYGVSSIEEAKDLLKMRLKKQSTMMEEDIKEKEAFEKEFGDKLK